MLTRCKNVLLCVQSPLRVAGKAVYVIDSERLALTSLPVMSPEVVRCVWDEHRRLRRRCSPEALTGRSRASKIGTLNNKNVKQGTSEFRLPREVIAGNYNCCSEASDEHGERRTTENCEESNFVNSLFLCIFLFSLFATVADE